MIYSGNVLRIESVTTEACGFGSSERNTCYVMPGVAGFLSKPSREILGTLDVQKPLGYDTFPFII